ncbi:MAG: Wadjet anti-phage system protein JetD domain-containing protein [Terracidiphilus sp.]
MFEFLPQWGIEEKQATRNLSRLTPPEQALYDALRNNSIQGNLRLEQERIGYRWVERAIRALL